MLADRRDVNPGPERWARARANAKARPTSHGAKLYRAREDFVKRFMNSTKDLEGTYAEMHYVGRYTGQGVWQRKHVFCSIECVVFQILLARDLSGQKPLTVAKVLGYLVDQPKHSQRDWTRITRDQLSRNVRCFVCGDTIEKIKPAPKALQIVPPVAEPELKKYVITKRGELIELEDLNLVALTEEAHEMLTKYVDDAGRATYGKDKGIPVQSLNNMV